MNGRREPIHTPATGRANEPLRFGEFLCDNNVIDEEQLLDALADHWANGGRLGTALSRRGLLTPEQVEWWAALYHDVSAVMN